MIGLALAFAFCAGLYLVSDDGAGDWPTVLSAGGLLAALVLLF